MKMRKLLLPAFWIATAIGLAILWQSGCNGTSPQAPPGTNLSGRPEGWSAETHGQDATPRYDVVFDKSQVKRLDIVLEPAVWQCMLDDMTELLGQFGTGGGIGVPGGGGPGGWPDGGSMQPPPEMYAACVGLNENDPCTVTLNGTTTQGICSGALGAQLVCMPQGMGPLDAGNPGGAGANLDLLAREPVWVPCTVAFEGKKWTRVGVRFKGNSTLTQTWSSGSYKLPMRLDFDQFEQQYPETLNQRFYGFKVFSLASNAMDSSYLREKVTGDLLRAAGVPVSARAFYRVFVDHGEGPIYFGLYTLVEIPWNAMLETQFGDASGNLYKPESTWQKDLPVDESTFPKMSHREAADWSDVKQAIAALHADRSDAADWRATLEHAFDADGFLRWLAVNTVIQDWDSYGNMAHNYYLYGDPKEGGRLRWIPWDHNLSLGGAGGMGDMLGGGDPVGGGAVGMGTALPLDMSTVDDRWPLIRFLFDDPVYNARYWDDVVEFVNGPFAAADVKARMQREHNLIEPYVTGPAGEQPSYTALTDPGQFDSALDALLAHVDSRQQAVSDAIAHLP